MLKEGDTIEVVCGASGLLALVIPVRLSGDRLKTVTAICGLMALDVELSKRWGVWAVFHGADWAVPEVRPGGLRLKFLQ